MDSTADQEGPIMARTYFILTPSLAQERRGDTTHTLKSHVPGEHGYRWEGDFYTYAAALHMADLLSRTPCRFCGAPVSTVEDDNDACDAESCQEEADHESALLNAETYAGLLLAGRLAY